MKDIDTCENAKMERLVSVVQSTAHPRVCLFHVLFKCVALLTYMFGSLLLSYVNTFVLVMLALAFDFWTVKNVTGRLLVGLRWWNEVQEDGTSLWVFESHQSELSLDQGDRFVFWNTQYVFVALWITLSIINVLTLSLSWLLLSACGVSFAAANLVGYWKCSRDAQARLLENISNNAVTGVVFNRMVNLRLMEKLSGSLTGSSQQGESYSNPGAASSPQTSQPPVVMGKPPSSFPFARDGEVFRLEPEPPPGMREDSPPRDDSIGGK
ncbi:unnamed protein product [Amoebophrya sp. A25]|nr:unnamed protein product [Amoebophrya sp. A25]|eukprot:GSA25T00022548001.1